MGTAVRLLVSTATAALVLSLAGCGDGGSGQDGSGEAQQPAPVPQAATADGSAGGSDEGARADSRPATAQQPQPSAADLANFSCTRRRGGTWVASGDITNSATQAMVYTVTVATVDGAEVSGARSEKFLLKADESTSFAVRRISQGAADACMPHVVRAPR